MAIELEYLPTNPLARPLGIYRIVEFPKEQFCELTQIQMQLIIIKNLISIPKDK